MGSKYFSGTSVSDQYGVIETKFTLWSETSPTQHNRQMKQQFSGHSTPGNEAILEREKTDAVSAMIVPASGEPSPVCEPPEDSGRVLLTVHPEDQHTVVM